MYYKMVTRQFLSFVEDMDGLVIRADFVWAR